MKLRNKNSGVIMRAYPIIRPCANEPDICYPSISELNEDWEDVKDPLIKDEKISKAVRAWAEANDYDNDDEFELRVYSTVYKSWSLTHTHNDENEIHFNEGLNLSMVRNNGIYTITELCGRKNDNSD